jgi:hypothetical protein
MCDVMRCAISPIPNPTGCPSGHQWHCDRGEKRYKRAGATPQDSLAFAFRAQPGGKGKGPEPLCLHPLSIFPEALPEAEPEPRKWSGVLQSREERLARVPGFLRSWLAWWLVGLIEKPIAAAVGEGENRGKGKVSSAAADAQIHYW